jgi:tetratricopeptide (TPR) repeat protein
MNLNLHSEISHLNLGAIYILREKAKKINPNTASVYFNLGHAYLKKGLHEKAIEAYEESLKHQDHVNFHYVTEYNLGKLYFEKRQYELAAEKFRNSISRNPNNSEAYNNLGITFLHGLKKPGEALIYLEKAISLNPGLTIAVIQFCEALYQLEEYERLRVLAVQLTEVKPGDGIGYFYLGMSMLNTGMDGCNHIEKAVEMGETRAKHARQLHCQ